MKAGSSPSLVELVYLVILRRKQALLQMYGATTSFLIGRRPATLGLIIGDRSSVPITIFC